MSDTQDTAIVAAGDASHEDTAVPAVSATEEAGSEEAGKVGDESADESAQSEDNESKPKHEGGFQKRIRKLTQQREEKEREAEYWRKVALEAQSKPKPETEAAAKPVAEKPKYDDFATAEEYIEALTDWKTENVIRKYEETKSKAETQRQQEEARQAAIQTWQQKQDSARAKYDDFDEVMESDTPVSDAMKEVIHGSEQGAEIAYFLGKNPDKAKKIAAMDPLQAAHALGRIEAGLTAAKSEPVPPKEPATSRAPKPITPVSKPSGSTVVDINDPNISYKDFVREREAQKKRK